MKTLIALTIFAVSTLAQAQVYVPPGGGYPICMPQTVATPDGVKTIVVCQ